MTSRPRSPIRRAAQPARFFGTARSSVPKFELREGGDPKLAVVLEKVIVGCVGPEDRLSRGEWQIGDVLAGARHLLRRDHAAGDGVMKFVETLKQLVALRPGRHVLRQAKVLKPGAARRIAGRSSTATLVRRRRHRERYRLAAWRRAA